MTILSFMMYAMLVALLFGLAAVGTERVFLDRGWARRALWMGCLAGSVAFPALMGLIAAKVPAPEGPAVVAPTLVDRPTDLFEGSRSWKRVSTGDSRVDTRPAINQRASRGYLGVRDLDLLLRRAWFGSSLGLLCLYALGWSCLARIARRWPLEHVDCTTIRVADAVGPAVFGYFRPEIVLPRWLLSAPPGVRAMVLSHEREHIAGRDPLIMLGALLLCALSPWNLPLWWQLRRLRLAIEMDCDARVLRGGAEARAYGEMLLVVSQRRARIPLGAIAMTERFSRLERRIHALVRAPRRGGRWLTALAVVFAGVFIVAAAQLSAPPLRSASELRKLPPEDMSPGAQWARDAARSRFPELFEQEFDGTAVLTLIFNQDGTILRANKTLLPADSAPSGFNYMKAAEAAGAEDQDVAYGGNEDWLTIGPWLESRNSNRIDVVYAVLKWPPDPTRSTAHVAAAVRAHFPQLFQNEPAADPKIAKRVAVFMNDDGTVGRADSEIMRPGHHTSLNFDAPERFTALGISAEQIGRHGWFEIEPRVMIGYAWPRRPEEILWDPDKPHSWLPKEYVADDRAIIERYFPDASRTTLRQFERRWILFGRDGRVWATGVGLYRSEQALFSELEARFPGIKVSTLWNEPARGSNCLGATEAERQTLRVQCVWLLPDSPVTDKANVDLNRRPDLFLAAHVHVVGPNYYAYIPVPASLTYGSWTAPERRGCTQYPQPNLVGCSLRFIAHEIRGGQAEVTVGHQAPGQKDVVPLADGTVRVNYGEEVTVQSTDADGRPLEGDARVAGIVLMPINLRPISGNLP